MSNPTLFQPAAWRYWIDGPRQDAQGIYYVVHGPNGVRRVFRDCGAAVRRAETMNRLSGGK